MADTVRSPEVAGLAAASGERTVSRIFMESKNQCRKCSRFLQNLKEKRLTTSEDSKNLRG
jgi:hypothetical protein